MSYVKHKYKHIYIYIHTYVNKYHKMNKLYKVMIKLCNDN